MELLWAFILVAVCFFALGILISDLIIFKAVSVNSVVF